MRVTISIEDEIIDQIDVIRKKKDRSRSKMIKIVIKEYLRRHNYAAALAVKDSPKKDSDVI